MQQDIHLRVRHPDPEKPSRLLPPTSAVSYFMIEKVNPAAGGVVMWEERIRLKHVVSQRYTLIGKSFITLLSAAAAVRNWGLLLFWGHLPPPQRPPNLSAATSQPCLDDFSRTCLGSNTTPG